MLRHSQDETLILIKCNAVIYDSLLIRASKTRGFWLKTQMVFSI